MGNRPAARRLAIAAIATSVIAAKPASAHDPGTDVGGEAAEIEAMTRVEGHFGVTQPTERRSTWQPANIKVLAVQAGVGFGRIGPFDRLRATVEGAYFVSAEEQVERTGDALPVGFPFYPEDSSGYVRLALRANVVTAPSYALELFLRGTIPIDVDLAKFSNVHIHYVSGGGTLRAHLTEPDELVRLDAAGTMFVGSGAYDGTFQHNAQLGLDALVGVSFRRWLLPWRVTVMTGPAFLADLDEQINDVYRDAYSAVSPDLMAGDRVQQMQLAIRVRPTFAITDNAALDLRFDGQLTGADAKATQIYTAALRAAF